MKIAVVSGGFDPLHSGHIEYIRAAAQLGDELWVCLNSDAWLKAKKGKAFMPFEERKHILESLKYISTVISFDDSDGSCLQGLEKISQQNPHAELIFCNGGDRNRDNIPENSFSNIKLAFGVGGEDKKNSSSTILKSWNINSESRSWGQFNTLLSRPKLKVKELIVKPKQGMSFQRHQYRSEVWIVHEGVCKVYFQRTEDKKIELISLKAGDLFEVPLNSRHQIVNDGDKPCIIIEVQRGKRVDENDIERFLYYPDTP